MTENACISPEIANSSLPVVSSACDGTQLEQAECDITRIDEVSEKALEALTARFRAIAKVSDDYAINAAFTIKWMRNLVERGAAGVGVTWYSWAAKLGLPSQRIQRYLRIADAKNPSVMRDEFLRQDRERAKKSRAKRKAIDPKRQRLSEWSRKAPLARVERVWKVIEKGKLQL